MILKARFVNLSSFLFVLIWFICHVDSQKQIEQEILKKILSDPYDRRIRPVSRDNASEPVSVSVNLYVRSIDNVDETKMEYDVQLTFRLEWNDWRLSFARYNPPIDLEYLTLTEVENVWRPDIFFSNEKRGHLHGLMVPNNYMRIWANGDILYSSRISMTLYCPMNMRLFPHDEQTCSIRLASYGYTNRDVLFVWKDNKPVQVTPDLVLPRFTFNGFKTDTCDSTTNTGTYSCLRLDFLFNREVSYYILQIYIPCTMLVILSWLPFWLDRKSVTARALLGIATLLVMATQVTSFNEQLPKVSYAKAIDQWTGICLTFVFASLLEFTAVNYLTRYETEASNKRNIAKSAQSGSGDVDIPLDNVTTEEESNEGKAAATTGTSGLQKTGTLNKLRNEYWAQFSTLAEQIDGASRVLFPITFLVFVFIYWIAY